ncbi:MAG: HPr family phosphocarrier protein [Clostridiales bacterium]|nr:HPr family phosphocarrier protein [Clostridiales bacterium]
MKSREVTIVNKMGIHARPASVFVRTAMKYPCEIYIEKNGRKFSSKSMMKVLSAGVKYGESIRIITDGQGEDEALEALASAVESGLGDL